MTNHTQTSIGTKALLILNGVVAGVIGGLVTFSPEQLFALTGITLGTNPNMLSEIRAPGGVLLLAAAFVTAAAFVRPWRRSALAVSAFLYLGYAFGRMVSVAVDGVPADDLLWALAIELVLGALSVLALVTYLETPRQPSATSFTTQTTR